MPTFEQMLKHAGVSPDQRAKIFAELHGAADDDKNNTGRPRSSEVYASLAQAYAADLASSVTRHLSKHGYLFEDGIESVNAAAVTEQNLPLHKQIKAIAARMGFDYHGQHVDPIVLDAAIKNQPVTERMRLKHMMMSAGVLSRN